MRSSNYPLRITAIYLVISILWIALSDSAVMLLPDAFHAPLQMLKGWFFVCMTGALIYSLIQKEKQITSGVIENLESSKVELDTLYSKNTSMLEALPIAIIEVDFSGVKQYMDQHIQSYDGELEDWFKASPQSIHSILELIEIRSVDGAACEMFGIDSPDHLISEFKDRFTAISIDNIQEDLIHFYSGQNSVKNETEFVRADGSVFDASTFASLTRDAEDSWQRLVVIIEDITNERQT